MFKKKLMKFLGFKTPIFFWCSHPQTENLQLGNRETTRYTRHWEIVWEKKAYHYPSSLCYSAYASCVSWFPNSPLNIINSEIPIMLFLLKTVLLKRWIPFSENCFLSLVSNCIQVKNGRICQSSMRPNHWMELRKKSNIPRKKSFTINPQRSKNSIIDRQNKHFNEDQIYHSL